MFSITGFVSFRNCHLIQNVTLSRVTLSGTHSISPQRNARLFSSFRCSFTTTKKLAKWATFAAQPGGAAVVMEDHKTTSSSTFGAPRTSRRRRREGEGRGREGKKYSTATRDRAPNGCADIRHRKDDLRIK